jgi:hypothetical protein
VIAAQRDEQVIPRTLSRRALEVSRSWFYKWPSDGLACGSAGPGVGAIRPPMASLSYLAGWAARTRPKVLPT